MAITNNTTNANATLDAAFDIYNAGTFKIYTGAQPARDVAATGTLLVTITIPAAAFGVAASASKAKNGTWQAAAAAAGTAGYYQLSNTGGTRFEYGSVGISATDAIIDNTSIAVSQVVTVNTFTKTLA